MLFVIVSLWLRGTFCLRNMNCMSIPELDLALRISNRTAGVLLLTHHKEPVDREPIFPSKGPKGGRGPAVPIWKLAEAEQVV